MMITTTGWAVLEPGGTPTAWAFDRRDPLEDDVVVRVTHCGICCANVHDMAPGDRVAVGNIIGSCRTCAACRAGRENDCELFPTLTYGGPDPYSGGTTRGGFSTSSARGSTGWRAATSGSASWST
jgi:alcohol dehydrogenase (NADP+)